MFSNLLYEMGKDFLDIQYKILLWQFDWYLSILILDQIKENIALYLCQLFHNLQPWN